MKKLLLIVIFTFIALKVHAQCNCQKINRGDGTQVIQCEPKMIASDNSTQIGFAAASNGRDEFISITVRFRNSAQKIDGDLDIRLKNNNMVNLNMLNSQLSYIGNSELAHAIYQVDGSNISKLKSSGLYTVSFQLEDKMMRTYEVEKDADILIEQLKCL